MFLQVIIVFLFIRITIAAIVCPANKVYVKVHMKCMSYCNEQKWKIKDGTTVVQEGPVYVNYEDTFDEYCLFCSTNNVYILELKDTGGDPWTAGSYIEFIGINDNIVFKNYVKSKPVEVYAISLYTPIMKIAAWKMTTGSTTGTWTKVGYSDDDWTSVTLGSVSTSVSGTQYFRKTFAGITAMAAYEVQFKYRYGIVAYVNGKEIFRDNMPAGVVVSETAANGFYQTVSYKGVLRPASEATATQSVLAVELHFLNDVPITAVSFDSFLAMYAPSVMDQPCHIVALPAVISGNAFDAPEAFDWNYESNADAMIANNQNIITFSYIQSAVIPMVNGFRICPSSEVSRVAKKYVLEGSMTDATGVFMMVVADSDVIYKPQIPYLQFSNFNSDIYTFYRFTVQETYADFAYIHESQPCVCNIPSHDLIFDPDHFTLYVGYYKAMIQPTIIGYFDCSVEPQLPTGLIMNENTCVISGIPMMTIPPTIFTVTSHSNDTIYHGTFTLSVPECDGAMLEIVRIYRTNAGNEGFSITIAGTDTSLLTVNLDSGQGYNDEKHYMLCTTEQKLSVNLICSVTNWYYDSYLYVNSLLSDTDRETLVRARFDSFIGAPVTVYFNAQYAIKPMQQWYYKMSMVPNMWYNSATDGWSQAVTGTFPASTNRIQLYKKTFTVTSLANTAGYTVSLRYKYGCVVYVNDIEVFRNGVAAGPVTITSEVTNFYPDIKFHTVSLPSRTMMVGTTAGTAVLKQGSNSIAIALVAMKNTQINATFDATVNLMGQDSTPRVWDYSVTVDGSIDGSKAFDEYHSNYYSGSTCGGNSLTITFNNDRREWISSLDVMIQYDNMNYSPTKFNVLGRNSGSDTWVPIKTVTGMTWSLIGQHKKVWLENNVSYNQYKFENWSTGHPESCEWRVQRLMLYSDNLAVDIPALTYPDTTAYMDVEMAEVFPSSSLYSDFSVSTPLPTGIVIDSQTGIISGTSHVLVTIRSYEITSRIITGAIIKSSINLDVQRCTDGKSLITVRIRSDSYPIEGSWKLYQGNGVNGTIIASTDIMPAANSLIFVDKCLTNGIYTFEGRDSWGDGWFNPAGFTLSIDLGEMLFDMRMIPRDSSDSHRIPVTITNVFSSYLPFQIVFSDWKFLTEGVVATDWNTLTYNDALWTEKKAAAICTSELITIYIRKSFDIPSLTDYSVLNIRMKYTGGAVVYLNGRRVARFNLEEEFTAESTGVVEHDSSLFSKFHIILATSGAVQGNNVIAIEVHRGLGQSSSAPVVFDATGVFGVDACVPVLDTLSTLTGSEPTNGKLTDLFDMLPYSMCTLPNSVGTHVDWVVENMEGSKFNSYGIYVSNDITSLSMKLLNRSPNSDDLILNNEHRTIVSSRKLNKYETPVGFIGFNSFHFEITAVATAALIFNEIVFSYCKASGPICEAVGNYPAVSEGQISPSTCDYGYMGYTYRKCNNGKLDKVEYDNCKLKTPENLVYDSRKYVFVKNTKVETAKPTYDYIIDTFKLKENVILPEGLHLDAKTGIIYGIPLFITEGVTEYVIYGENRETATSVTLLIQVRYGECKASDNFPTSLVNSTVFYNCAKSGYFVGSQRRVCTLGEHDGEWGRVMGFCMSVVALVAIVIIIVVVVCVIVVIIVRMRSRRRAVGGMKSRKNAAVVKKGLGLVKQTMA